MFLTVAMESLTLFTIFVYFNYICVNRISAKLFLYVYNIEIVIRFVVMQGVYSIVCLFVEIWYLISFSVMSIVILH